MISEYFLQKEIVRYLEHKYPDLFFFHIPNGEKRDIITATKLKRMGVKSGAPDLFFPSLKLCIELKRSATSRLSKTQLEMKDKFEQNGYIYKVFHEFKAFKIYIDEILSDFRQL